ncbi:hypothetical protein NQ317_002800 [Molorchus minor]|uniref:Helicase ATP-binding domain-containing protein n=1 Tax=Molorchus minor TaxID=1323400 RepID=A0ABQ9J7E5_9CUCU|nr:hypothetical protein NQ317_002800 [Molorchus minor]
MFSKENVNPMNLQDENAQVEADLSEQRTLKIDNKEECKDENQTVPCWKTLKLEENIKNLDVHSYTDTVKILEVSNLFSYDFSPKSKCEGPYYKNKANSFVCDKRSDKNYAAIGWATKNGEHNTMTKTPSEVFKALYEFANSFPSWSRKTVMRILSGKLDFVTLSTGSGKSLCYQLPAYLFSKRGPCISLIVSPLVSLMMIISLSSFKSNENSKTKILEAISLGELSILLVSPEAIVAGENSNRLPPIAFACIDEAHCVSQWSHNFRPSYLMICRVLRESLGVKTILGLTATATRATRESIIEHLQISDGHDGVISDIPLPDNLKLSVSKDLMRDSALLGLLMTARFSDCRSEMNVRELLHFCGRLENEKVVEDTNKRERASLQAEPYHAGLPARP